MQAPQQIILALTIPPLAIKHSLPTPSAPETPLLATKRSPPIKAAILKARTTPLSAPLRSPPTPPAPATPLSAPLRSTTALAPTTPLLAPMCSSIRPLVPKAPLLATLRFTIIVQQDRKSV